MITPHYLSPFEIYHEVKSIITTIVLVPTAIDKFKSELENKFNINITSSQLHAFH